MLLVLAPVVWALGFGPAVWLTAEGCLDREVVERAYGPILSAAVGGPEAIREAISWWGSLGVRRGRLACFDIGLPKNGDVWLDFFGPGEPFGVRMGLELPPRK